MTTKQQLELIAAGVVDTVSKAIRGPQVHGRIAQLEARISALEAAPKSLDYKGTWQRASDYHRNQAATHKGQLWMCLTDSVRGVEPGTSPACWQLADKGQHV